MRRRGEDLPGWRRFLLPVMLSLTLVLSHPSLSLAQVFIKTKEPIDPQAREIKTGLERRGMKVYDVLIRPAAGREPAIWAALTAALYGTPTTGSVMDQAANTWDVMNTVLTREPPFTTLVAAQVWSKYILNLMVAKRDWLTFVQAWEGATEDEVRRQAARALMKAMRFTVFDIERQQFISEKDFINKNFGD